MGKNPKIKVDTAGLKVLKEIFEVANKNSMSNLDYSSHLLGVASLIEVDNEYFKKQEIEAAKKMENAKKVEEVIDTTKKADTEKGKITDLN